MDRLDPLAGPDLVLTDKTDAQPFAKACSGLSDAEMAKVAPSSTPDQLIKNVALHEAPLA